jgi:hypothetical protein
MSETGRRGDAGTTLINAFIAPELDATRLEFPPGNHPGWPATIARPRPTIDSNRSIEVTPLDRKGRA